MNSGGGRTGPSLGSIVLWAVLGSAASLVTGLLVAALLNSYLATDWVRGIATLAVGAAVAGFLLRLVVITARAKMRLRKDDPGVER